MEVGIKRKRPPQTSDLSKSVTPSKKKLKLSSNGKKSALSLPKKKVGVKGKNAKHKVRSGNVAEGTVARGDSHLRKDDAAAG